jgi:hypothetical protein
MKQFMVFKRPESKKISEIKNLPFAELSEEEQEEKLDELLNELATLRDDSEKLLNKLSKNK